MNPLLAPLWIGGLAWLLLSTHRKFRFLALTFLVVLLLLLTMKGKIITLLLFIPCSLLRDS